MLNLKLEVKELASIMQSKSTKAVLGVIVIAIIFVIGLFVGKAVFDNGSTPANNQTKTTTSSEQTQPTDQLTKVMTSPLNYVGKQITVKGELYKVDNSNYFLVEPVQKVSKKTPNTIKLDFSKANLDPSKYANVGSTTEDKNHPEKPNLKPSVTVTGTLTNNKTLKQFVLVVSSLKA